MIKRVTPLVTALVLVATAAAADPCKAIPDNGPLPSYLRPGAEFSGRVAYVGDGDSLCIAQGVSPSAWIEVRLADFYAPELAEPGGERAKQFLTRTAFGRHATCIAEHRSHDRIVARCTINGVGIGDRLRSLGAAEGGRGYANP